ncbi:acetyl-CoA carboxylase carboxyltransferase subunit beta [Lactobacillus sp. ESL0701]|uniref:acetyl-CoA carboxylase carboxyltransferase subunit beta n=1 Tax=Lactobacillus sp. ESL0701 TaxID=2983217 RepID=UPI0023F73643|nr:acetyl-CoA carboxylase carboxyltransferase subunit beta [Lactobacillus sp. ESL0701]MDF7672799.1 acetyl-CoA carboxylase carboxyltransferase subunit beta [Lactobacillus sp. ESL0701]
MAAKFARHPKQALKDYEEKVPKGIFRYCQKCGAKFYFARAGKYHVCPNCGYGFRVTARQRLKMLTKQFTEWDTDLTTTDPLKFPGYQEKLTKAREQTKLQDAVLTGQAEIRGQQAALGIMDPAFIMGSLGTANGERITRLFEKATELSLPVIMFTASGGARMQEGIQSLMQMAKISQAVNDHRAAGLPYIVVIMDPTTGGVTASFASQADIILAEPKAMVAFAGRRVIEQTIHKKLPQGFQSAENAYQNGFVDAIVPRSQQVDKLGQLLTIFAGQKWRGANGE